MKKTIIGSMVIISTLLLSACSFGNNKPLEIVTDEYDFDDNIKSINLDISFEDVHIMESDDDKCHIVFTHPENPKTVVEVKKDTLVISEYFSFSLDNYSSDFDDTKLDIYLPQSELKEIDIDTASGDITISNITAYTIDIDTASGDIAFDDIDADTIKIDTTSGDISGTLLSGKDFEVDTMSGSISVPSDSEGGSCDIDTVSGDVDLKVN